MSNITIDDSSPLITYSSKSNGWTDNSTSDTSIVKYFAESYHTTKTDQDAMSFTFNGTAVYVYGAFRQNHGLYSASVDGGPAPFQSGEGKELFQQVLYSEGGLSPDKEHTVVITNTPAQSSNPNFDYLDIDYIVVTTAKTGTIYSTAYDDSSSAFAYSGGWQAKQNDEAYLNGTSHLSLSAGSTVTFPFNGSTLEMFGATNFDHGQYSASLDGGVPQRFNGTSYTLFSPATIYMVNGLNDGVHQVVLSNLGGGPGGTGQAFDFDYAVVNSSNSPTLSQTGTNGTSTNISADPSAATAATGGSGIGVTKAGSKTNVGAIAGGVVGGVVALILLGLLLWFFRRRRNRHYRQKGRDPVDLNGEANQPDLQDGREVKPFPLSSGGYTSSSPYVENTGGYGSPAALLTQSHDMSQSSGAPMLTTIPPPPASNATSYPRSAPATNFGDAYQGYDDDRLTHSGSTASRYQSTTPASSTSATAPLAPPIRTIPPPHTIPTKVPSVPLPFTARQPSSPPIRMNVAGREQDMGPIPLSDDGHDASGGILPPDYEQATEPLPGQRSDQHHGHSLVD